MTGFEPGSSGIRSDRSAKFAITTVQVLVLSLTEDRDEANDEADDETEDGRGTEARSDVPHIAVGLVIGVVNAADDLKTQF